MSNLAKFAGVVSAAALSLASGGWAQPNTSASTKAVTDRYCAGCHSDSAKAGGLSLQSLNPEDPAAAPEIWEKVVRKLTARQMPPLGKDRPGEDAIFLYLALRLDKILELSPFARAFGRPVEAFHLRRAVGGMESIVIGADDLLE